MSLVTHPDVIHVVMDIYALQPALLTEKINFEHLASYMCTECHHGNSHCFTDSPATQRGNISDDM